MKQTYKYYLYIFSLSFVFMQSNPWILTTEEKPKKDSKILVSLGAGSGGFEDEELVSFKYAFLSPSSSNSMSGFSFSGYSQDAEHYSGGWFGNYSNVKQTEFLFAYTYLKSITNKEEFNGLFYGYDVGLTFKVNDSYPLGITFEVIESFFDDKKRTNLGLGMNASLGYKMKNFLFSLTQGFKWIGEDDLFFFKDSDDGIEKTYFSFNLSMLF